MSIVITGISERTEIRAPSNREHGESGNFIETTVQPVANNIEWSRMRIPGAADEARRDIALDIGKTYTSGPTIWSQGLSEQNVDYWTQTTNATNALVFDITSIVPHRCSITGFAAAIAPPSGHAGLPNDRPVVLLLRRTMLDLPSVAWTQIGVVADPSASVAAYQSPHVVGRFIDVNLVDKATLYRWALAVIGEGGTNSLSGLLLLGAYITVGP